MWTCFWQRSRTAPLGQQDSVVHLPLCLDSLPSCSFAHTHGGEVLQRQRSPCCAKEWRTTSAGIRNLSLRSISPTTAFDHASDPPPATAEENSQMYICAPDDMSAPILTHLPSSTESPSSDRTVHMASFIDGLGANRCFDLTVKHPLSPMYHSAPPHAPANPPLFFGSETYCLGECPSDYCTLRPDYDPLRAFMFSYLFVCAYNLTDVFVFRFGLPSALPRAGCTLYHLSTDISLHGRYYSSGSFTVRLEKAARTRGMTRFSQ